MILLTYNAQKGDIMKKLHLFLILFILILGLTSCEMLGLGTTPGGTDNGNNLAGGNSRSYSFAEQLDFSHNRY